MFYVVSAVMDKFRRHCVHRRSWADIIDTPNVYRIVLHFCIALYCQLDSVIKLYYVSIVMLLRFCFWFSKILLLLIYHTEERCAYNLSWSLQVFSANMLMSSIGIKRRSITATAVLSGSFDAEMSNAASQIWPNIWCHDIHDQPYLS